MKTSPSDRAPLIRSLAVLALLTLTPLAPSASADTLKLSQDLTNYSVGNGGGFIVSNFTGPINLSGYSAVAQGDGGFLTFCVEYNEEFVPGQTFLYTLSFGARNGGLTGQTPSGSNYDGLSNAAAWLYSQFATGSLTGVNGFTYSHANLGELQQAIWFLEGEGGTNNYLVAAAQNHEGANWNADNNGAYGVQVINLYYLNGANSQDQLYYNPAVPENASTIALLGLALVGLAGLRRRFGK